MTNFSDHPIFSRMYWRRNETTKTSCQEAEATHVEIQVRNAHYRNSFEFEWPREQVKAGELVAMLESAFSAGRRAAQADVRAVIGL